MDTYEIAVARYRARKGTIVCEGGRDARGDDGGSYGAVVAAAAAAADGGGGGGGGGDASGGGCEGEGISENTEAGFACDINKSSPRDPGSLGGHYVARINSS